MTYLIVGNKEENIKEGINSLLKKLLNRPIKQDIFDGHNPDIHFLNGSNLNSIGIEDVKALQKKMIFSPFKESVQIAIIFNAEKLTIQAQNSFLKTLEDSNDSTVYVFVTNNENNLLPTVISRSLRIYTKGEKEKLEDNGIQDILGMDIVEAFKKIEEISKEKESTNYFLKQLELSFQKDLERKIKKGEEINDIYDNIQRVVETRKRLDANGNKRLLLESLYLDLTG